MEWFLLGCFALFLVFGPWIFILILRKRLYEQGRLLDARLSDFTRRLYEIESSLRELKRPDKHEPVSVPEPQAVPTKDARPTPPQPIKIAESQKPIPAPPVTSIPPARENLPPKIPVPVVPSSTSSPTIAEKIRESGGIEEVLGKNWLNKLGIVLLVIGVAFFLAFQLKTLGPAGKVLVGYAVSFA